MKTLDEIIEIIKLENVDGLRVGNEETGYTPLSAKEYDAQILQWAQGRLAKFAQADAAEQAELARTAAQAKLAALGLTTDDLAALGL